MRSTATAKPLDFGVINEWAIPIGVAHFQKEKDKSEFMEETMMDKKTQKIGVICSIVQIILSIICLIYNAINQENIIIWVLFLCSGILLLSSNISRNNKKEDE